MNNIEWTRYFNDGGSGIKVFNGNNNYFVFCDNGDSLSIAKLDSNGYGFCNFDTITYITENISYNVTSIPVSTSNVNFLSDSGSFIFNNVNISSVVYCTDVNAIHNYESYNDICISVFPNPATEIITIENLPQQATIEILNIQGQLIETLATTGNKTNLNVSAFPCGVYIVEVKTEKGVAVKKFVKE